MVIQSYSDGGHIPPFLEMQRYTTGEHTAYFITQESTD